MNPIATRIHLANYRRVPLSPNTFSALFWKDSAALDSGKLEPHPHWPRLPSAQELNTSIPHIGQDKAGMASHFLASAQGKSRNNAKMRVQHRHSKNAVGVTSTC